MKILPVTLLGLFALPASATLLITEVNSNGTPADFWELTNFGETAVDLGGYVWDDDAKSPGRPQAKVIPSGTVIAPGESIVFAVTDHVSAFRAAWELAEDVQVIAGGPGLGKNDEVHLYASSTAKSALVSLKYGAGQFRRSNNALSLGGHAGPSAGGLEDEQSLIWDPNFGTTSPRYTFATGGNFETYQALGGTQTGSPGRVGVAGSNSAPVIIGSENVYWRDGMALANSDFRISVHDPDAGQSVSVVLEDGPSWLGLSAVGGGKWKLTGTPEAGRHEFTLRASDDAGEPASSTKEFVLTVFPETAPVILNEYNAISSDNLPSADDPYFGKIAGNGGDWFELVVTGDGTAGSTVDMRGWKIDITTAGKTETMVLSQEPYWADVLAGTILTFIETNTENGGLDTEINRVSAHHNKGYSWSNIWILDPIFVDQGASDFGDGIAVNNEDTTFTIRDAAGDVVYGPAGEGVAHKDDDDNDVPDTVIGIGKDEVMVLRGDALHDVDPFFGRYRAENFSTFGAPNKWNDGGKEQDFVSYKVANTPATFTSQPLLQARGEYRYEITATDPDSAELEIRAEDLPDFLTLTSGEDGTAVLESNRALGAAEAGQHLIRLLADDGVNVTPQAFYLTVFSASSPVILNEYNAVAADRFLNGGVAASDEDGGAAADAHFGRVPGNGGTWFELVVVGDGGAGDVDLRGWKVEIGGTSAGAFVAQSTLELADHPAWEAVPAGTILTFIAENSAQGGLDTQFEIRNRRATHGDVWSNVWMGDSEHLVYTDEASNGYALNDGVVEGIVIDSSDTQFRLIDGAGQVSFGPSGEGIAPVSGVSGTEVFELKGHPTPETSPLATADESQHGYHDKASGSSFGWPNEWEAEAQDFTPFIAIGYDLWVIENGLSGENAAPDADPDGDGRSNFHEYAFGGDPQVADGEPGAGTLELGEEILWSHVRRADDSGISWRYEFSEDLEAWASLAVEEVSKSALVELPGYERVNLRIVDEPTHGRWFVRAVAE